MKYVISAEGAKIIRGLIICQQCGGVDHVMTYCRTQNGREIQERRCVCGNHIRIETEEQQNA